MSVRISLLPPHFRGEHADLVAAAGLGLQHRLVGLVHQFGHVTGAGFTEGDAEADRPADLLAADLHRLVGDLPQQFGVGDGAFLVGRAVHHGDELVAAQPGQQMLLRGGLGQSVRQGLQELVPGGVPEEAVQRLQPVDVDEDHRDRARSARAEPLGEVVGQSAAVGQGGQLVVVGQVPQPLLGGDPGLQLSQQRGHRPQRVDLVVVPLPVAELDETQGAGGGVAAQQRHRRQRHALDAGALPDPVLVLVVMGGSGDQHRRQVFQGREGRVGAGEIDHPERVRLRNIGPRWPFGDQHGGAQVVVVAPQEAQIHLEIGHQPVQQVRRRRVQGRRGHPHQVGGDRGHQIFQSQLHHDRPRPFDDASVVDITALRSSRWLRTAGAARRD